MASLVSARQLQIDFQLAFNNSFYTYGKHGVTYYVHAFMHMQEMRQVNQNYKIKLL